MMKRVIYMGILPLMLNASLLDFQILGEAEKSYKDGNYTATIAQYSKLKTKSDEVIYDEANSYYKLKDYQKALELYDSISSPKLAFDKWHNLGNTHAQMGKLDEGIKAYEEALKIKEDEDTRFNLEFLKKKKKEQEQKQNKDKKNDKKNKDDKNQKDKKNQKKKNSDSKKSNEEKKKEEEKQKEAQKKKDEAEKKKEQEKKDSEKNSKKDEEKENKIKKAQAKKEPISDKELRKYQKMLDQRGINTLVVPLKTKGEQNNELKPW